MTSVPPVVSTRAVGSSTCECKAQTHNPKLIVLTGGPSAGKTAVLEMALKTFCSHVTVIPEAASIIFGGGFFRRETASAKKAAQRVIFKVQTELEGIILDEKQAAVAICDRGTVDGLAYWPGTSDEFWMENESSKEKEFAKYAVVIHLRTPDLTQGYNLDNPVRIESAQEALKIDNRIFDAWAGHPNRHLIESQDDFLSKATKAIETIQDSLPSCCRRAALDLKRNA